MSTPKPVINPAPPTFGCQWSVKGYEAAVKANGGKSVQTWPCILALGTNKQCAGIYAANYGVKDGN